MEKQLSYQEWGRYAFGRCDATRACRYGYLFCGSGGAGALTAATKYGYPERHGMRSIEEGITAIKDGKTVLGFGFMDQEELGKRLTEEFIKSMENRKRDMK